MIRKAIKTQDCNFNKYLTNSEFKCRCNYPECNVTLISQDLIESFFRLRNMLGLPLIVNSGFRCVRHNEEVGGVDNSDHTKGCAIDVSLQNLREKYPTEEIVNYAKQCGFNFIKIYPSFLHLAVRDFKNGGLK